MRGHRVAIVTVLGLTVGVGVGIAQAGGVGDADDRPAMGGMPVDVDGDGLISDQGEERLPALILAVGDSGIEGYVRLADLEGDAPTSPEEALEQSNDLRVIPVYAEDGVTVIDQLTESAQEGDEVVVPDG
jgi:hypothetical protein